MCTTFNKVTSLVANRTTLRKGRSYNLKGVGIESELETLKKLMEEEGKKRRMEKRRNNQSDKERENGGGALGSHPGFSPVLSFS